MVFKPLNIAFSDCFKIDEITGCWNWIYTMNTGGYGMYKNFKAHRYSYEYYKGPIPPGMCVCHTCDNRKCVNPDHLWLGTQKDNMNDMAKKGRADRTKKAKGARCRATKLTEEQVKEIYYSDKNCHQLAKEYLVTHQCISKIRRRETWGYLFKHNI